MNALVLSPNVEFLFADASADFNERVSIAAAAGVRAIEFWGWRDKDVDGLERVLRANDVRVTAMVIDPIVSMVCEPQQFVAAIRETAAVGGRLRRVDDHRRVGRPRRDRVRGRAVRPRGRRVRAMRCRLRRQAA